MCTLVASEGSWRGTRQKHSDWVTEGFSWCFLIAVLKQNSVSKARWDAGVGKGRVGRAQNWVIKTWHKLSSSFKAQIRHYLNFHLPPEPGCQSLGLLRGTRVCLSGLRTVLQGTQFCLDRAKEGWNCDYSSCLPHQWNCFLASQFPNYSPAVRFSNLSEVCCTAGTEPSSVWQCRVLSSQQFFICLLL